MKILLLSPLPPPVGGIASWTVNILEYYKVTKNIEIIHQNTAIKYRGITKLDFMSRLISGLKNGFRTIAYFFKSLRSFNPDVIHATSSGSMGLWKDIFLALLCKAFKIPLVIHFRFGRIPEISHLNNWEWKVLRRVVSLCAAVIVLDDDSLDVLKSQGFKNIYNIPNPISKNVEGFLFDDDKCHGTEKNSLVKVIFVGHVTKNKGVFELVEACSLLSHIDELVLIGPYEEDIKIKLLKIALNGNLQINFTGALNKKSVLVEMRTAAMLVLPSYSEGFPNVIIEAMAMKCPIVATNVGAVASILNIGSSAPAGVVIEPKDIKALTDAINLIITDTSQAEFFKKNAFSKVKDEYTLEKVCDQYEKVWNAVQCTQRDLNV